MTNDNSIVNGSKNAVGTDRSVRRSVVLESAGFGAAEFASMGVSLGVVAFMDKIVPKGIMNGAVNFVAKNVVEPNLDFIEKNMKKCRLEECQVDESKTREERARRLAKGVVVFGSAYITALGAKMIVRDKFNKHYSIGGGDKKPLPTDAGIIRRAVHHLPFVGASKDANMIALADEAVHIGSLVYLNTTASRFTDDHIHKLSNTLEKLGVSPQKAKEVSTMVMVWEVPNALGTAAGVGAIFGKHAYGWPYKHDCRSFRELCSKEAKSFAPQQPTV